MQDNEETKKPLSGIFSGVHGTLEEVFTHIYEQNIWRDTESVSGRGSSLSATVQLRTKISEFFKDMGIKSILDMPCGDFNWFKALDHNFESYVGYDIVHELIEKNQKQFGSLKTAFRHANILKESFEPADIALCRDFLIHSSNADIFAFFANLSRSNVSQILVTHYENCENIDIPTGNRYRPIDFTKPPFSFPEPLHLIEEDISSMQDTASRFAADKTKPLQKFLGHWNTADLYQILEQNPAYTQ